MTCFGMNPTGEPYVTPVIAEKPWWKMAGLGRKNAVLGSKTAVFGPKMVVLD